MKKIIFCVLFATIFALSVPFQVCNLAFAQNYSIKMDIEGIVYNLNVNIPEEKFIKTKGSFYSFVKQKIDEGFYADEVLNYISPGLGNGFFYEISKYQTPPVNAELFIDKKNHTFKYFDGKQGMTFDKNQAALALANALDGQKTKLKLVETSPEITLIDLKRRTRLLGEFATDLNGSSQDRKHNVALACNFINGITLNPNQEFSFNDSVGVRSEERGFKSAKVIVDGEYVQGVGGGVCQLATTLYNAVLTANLKVSRVARHSYPPKYIQPSRDAMVSQTCDFKFINNTTSPVYLFAYADDNKVIVKIYGDNPQPQKIYSEILKINPKNIVDIYGNLLAINEEDFQSKTSNYKLVSEGIDGVNSILYTISPSGNKIILRSDVYKTKNEVWQLIE